MRKLREVLRLSLALGLGPRAIGRSCSMSSSTVSGYVGRAKVAKLAWPLPPGLDDDTALERLLFPDEGRPQARRPEPEWARIHLELRKKNVTKALLWEEYKTEQPGGLQYSQFCDRYNDWALRLNVTMRQTHRAGEKMFIDFSGDGIDIVDRDTGVCILAKLFVAVLGASNLTYVEPVLSEDLPTWTGCHVRALEYFGGTAEIWVPDNLKSGVKSPDRYEPELNQTYAELARHYGAAVIPARVRTYPLTVLEDMLQLRPIARGPRPSARLNLKTSLNFRMDSLSADNDHLLFGRRRPRPSVQRRQSSGLSRPLHLCSALIDQVGTLIGFDRND